jgi:hypothetical protein
MVVASTFCKKVVGRVIRMFFTTKKAWKNGSVRAFYSLTMKRLFSPNIDKKGRLVRGCLALALLAGAAIGFTASVWLGVVLLASGAFVLFESLRGWCALRACGIKTKL